MMCMQGSARLIPVAKSSGPDAIPGRLLKEAAPVIDEPSYLDTRSLQTGEIPTDWITVHVTPIHKRGDRWLYLLCTHASLGTRLFAHGGRLPIYDWFCHPPHMGWAISRCEPQRLLASFPGPTQLFIACSTETRSFVQQKAVRGLGNEAKRIHYRVAAPIMGSSQLTNKLSTGIVLRYRFNNNPW